MSAYSGSFEGNGSQLTDIDYFSLSTLPKTISNFELNSIVANSHLRNNFTARVKAQLNVEGVVSSSIAPNDSSTESIATADNVGTLRYRADSNNSWVEICMQIAVSTYEWSVVKTHSW